MNDQVKTLIWDIVGVAITMCGLTFVAASLFFNPIYIIFGVILCPVGFAMIAVSTEVPK